MKKLQIDDFLLNLLSDVKKVCFKLKSNYLTIIDKLKLADASFLLLSSQLNALNSQIAFFNYSETQILAKTIKNLQVLREIQTKMPNLYFKLNINKC